MRSARAPRTRLLLVLTAALGASRAEAAAQASQATRDVFARHVAAPASDILAGVVRLPDPAAVPTASRAAVLPLEFRREVDGRWATEIELPVDRAGPLALALLSPDAGSWHVLARTPGSTLRPIEAITALERRVAPAGDEMPGWVLDRYDIADAPAGSWTVRVEADASRRPADGWLIARTASDLRIETHATTLRLVAGEPIGIVARATGGIVAPATGSEPVRVERARLVLEDQGRSQELAMHDDGQHEDRAAGDGLFGALLPADVRGQVRARVEIGGRAANGAPFLRTAQLAFPVLDRLLFLDGPARASALDGDRLSIGIGALPLAPPRRVHVSAEVWGRGRAGEAVPVCWLSRMLDPELHPELDGAWSLPLVLDARWLDVAGAEGPLELREVRVQDPDTAVVLDRVDRMPLAGATISPRSGRGARAITAEMLTGSSAITLSSVAPGGPHARKSPAWYSPGLLLVHGYCSGGAIWPPADFTPPKLDFLDPSANRTHDQFAQLMAQQAQAGGLSSFGVVAHSQGGCAALHLLTYYQSGLDLAQGARRIQSLATPYQGTPLASLGAFACGVNNDMTPAGAATWLAGIPSWARAEVWFWTTADAGSACNFFTSLFLADPEDGTVEKFRGDLPGAHSMGHVAGWCHTTGMTYPASYTDHARNQAMNAAAAR